MIDSGKYFDFVKRTFSFLVTENEMTLDKETTNGNAFYDVQFRDKEKVISISLENVENYFQVIFFKLDNGQRPDYDDKSRTIHLTELNKNFLTKLDKKEFEENDRHFDDIKTADKIEKQILTSAKGLRLCLNQMRSMDNDDQAERVSD